VCRSTWAPGNVQIITKLRQELAQDADNLLRARWTANNADDAPADGTQAKQGASQSQAKGTQSGNGEGQSVADPIWSSRSSQLAEVLASMIRAREDPSDCIATLADKHLAAVPASGGAGAKKRAAVCGEYPSLSPATFHVWFRCAMVSPAPWLPAAIAPSSMRLA
jgi:hypothetical protein